MTIDKPLTEITEADLQYYVDEKVVERKTLEYKEALPGRDDKAKKEFLADVSSFANAAGGHIIYGIKEENGEPAQLCGLGEINVDDEKQLLENLMRDCLRPRIPRVDILPVGLTTGGVAIVISIRTSWALPHVVSYRKQWRFYSRNSVGKYPLDVQELRSLFALSETRAEWIRNFRAERLARIVGHEPPVPLPEGAKLIVHLVPFSAPNLATKFDVTLAKRCRSKPRPIDARGYGPSHRYNFDGCLLYCETSNVPYVKSYLQFFRNGALEATTVSGLSYKPNDATPKFTFEDSLLERLPDYLEFMKEACMELPIALMVSLLGIRGYDVEVGRHKDTRRIPDELRGVERNDLILPEILIDSWETCAEDILRPVLDTIWSACGFPRCLLYDEHGNWLGE